MNGEANSILGKIVAIKVIVLYFEKINYNSDTKCGCCVVVIGDHTKALIGQLIIFNQILGELREDIREQVSTSVYCVSIDSENICFYLTLHGSVYLCMALCQL